MSTNYIVGQLGLIANFYRKLPIAHNEANSTITQKFLWVDRSVGSTSMMGPCLVKGTSKSTLVRESDSLSSTKWSELISEKLLSIHPYSLKMSSMWRQTHILHAKKKHRIRKEGLLGETKRKGGKGERNKGKFKSLFGTCV